MNVFLYVSVTLPAVALVLFRSANSAALAGAEEEADALERISSKFGDHLNRFRDEVEDQDAEEADEMEGDESRQASREVHQHKLHGTQACVSVDLTGFNWHGEKTSTLKVIKPAPTDPTHWELGYWPLNLMLYEEAQDACFLSGGELAELSTLEEQNRLFDEMQRKYVDGLYWIAASKEGSEVTWLNSMTKSVFGRDSNLEKVFPYHQSPNRDGNGVVGQYGIMFENPRNLMMGYVCEFPGAVCDGNGDSALMKNGTGRGEA